MSDSAVLQRLKMLLKDDSLVKKYIDTYGEEFNIAHIKEIKEANKQNDLLDELNSLDITPVKAEIIAVGDDPIYESILICPVCGDRKVVSYNLRAKSQFVEETPFLVPIYSGVGKYHKENFTKIQTTVCPSCFFASPDPKDFSKFVEYTERTVESQLKIHTKMLGYLKDTRNDRIEDIMLRGVKKDDFLRPRSTEHAIVAIELSILRAEIEQKHDLSDTYFKRGSYYLRIAHLQKQDGIDNIDSIEKACEMMEKAVTESDCSIFELEMQALYLCVALNVKLGNKEKIGGFMKLIKDVQKEVTDELTENPVVKNKKKHSTMEKWEKRAKTAVEYRDDESYWKDV